jgi:hypothetical protein
MAILQKRKSSKQLPEARGIQRSPLDSVIRGGGNAPSISGGRPSSLTSTGGSGGSSRPSLTTKTSSVPKTSLAPRTSLTTKPATTKPTITSKTLTTPTTRTQPINVNTRPTVTKSTGTNNSITSKVLNAGTGAIIGAGTKLLFDKVSGKPVATPPSGGTKTPAGGTTKPAGGTTRPAGGGSTPNISRPRIPTSTINPTTKLPTGTGFGDDKEEFTTDSLGNTYKTMPDGTSVLYRAAEVDEDVEATTPTGGGTRSIAGTDDTEITDGTDTTVASADIEYFQDDAGNIYTMNEDGSYVLFADANQYENDANDAFADNTYTDPDTNQVWTLADNGEWSTDGESLPDVEDMRAVIGPTPDFNFSDENDYLLADTTGYTDFSDYDTDYSDYDYAKRGGLITMMKNGGSIDGYADGGVTEYYDDGSYTITYDDGSTVTYDSDGDQYSTSVVDEDPVTGVFTPRKVTIAPGYSTGKYDPTNKIYSSSKLGGLWPAGYESNDDGTATMVNDDGSTMTVDADMNPIYTTNATDRTDTSSSFTDELGNLINKGTGLGKSALDSITGALGTTAGAAGAGALIATLLGQDFSGGTGAQNQGVDMSKVGVINPRTTDFGIGPTKFVGYEDYGTGGGDYTPNAELLTNLNAPGYNPVNEGDYGYEEVPEERTPQMASGGLSSMSSPVASYYTFGQPADILANLGMRPQPPMNPPEMMTQVGQQQQPQQAQQQGLPQQAPPQMGQQAPQGMPQQGMMPQQQGMPPPMRKGGLPHISNVPIVEGRMDFRQGSAVHGEGDGQSDDIPAMLADGEYVIDSETVAQIGNGSTKAGAQALDNFRESIRAHKRSAPVNKIPPKTKALTSYLKGAK